jgi:hypothetical protein
LIEVSASLIFACCSTGVIGLAQLELLPFGVLGAPAQHNCVTQHKVARNAARKPRMVK